MNSAFSLRGIAGQNGASTLSGVQRHKTGHGITKSPKVTCYCEAVKFLRCLPDNNDDDGVILGFIRSSSDCAGTVLPPSPPQSARSCRTIWFLSILRFHATTMFQCTIINSCSIATLQSINLDTATLLLQKSITGRAVQRVAGLDQSGEYQTSS